MDDGVKYYLIGNEKDYACLKTGNDWHLKEVFTYSERLGTYR